MEMLDYPLSGRAKERILNLGVLFILGFGSFFLGTILNFHSGSIL
ncbi:hypothetical protein [Desemzia sp. FAM 24101]